RLVCACFRRPIRCRRLLVLGSSACLSFTHPGTPLFCPFPYTTLFRSVAARVLPESTQLKHRRGVASGVMVFSRKAAVSPRPVLRSEEHTSELQSLAYLVCRPLLEKKIFTQPIAKA